MRAVALALTVLAAGCGPKDTDPGPGGVTVAEAKALDQAAEMLEQRRLPPAATQDEASSPPGEPVPGSHPSAPPALDRPASTVAQPS
jgi:hypothetical protein